MSPAPRRFILTRGTENRFIHALTVDDLTEAIGEHVHLYDEAELLACEAWTGKTVEAGQLTVSEK